MKLRQAANDVMLRINDVALCANGIFKGFFVFRTFNQQEEKMYIEMMICYAVATRSMECDVITERCRKL